MFNAMRKIGANNPIKWNIYKYDFHKEHTDANSLNVDFLRFTEFATLDKIKQYFVIAVSLFTISHINFYLYFLSYSLNFF